MFRREREEIKMKSLLTQLNFFDALENRHRLWADDADNSEIVQLHFEIIESLVEITDKYERLLHLYQQGHE